ncbi:MAG: T9SS type A sorting domain-containing protein, partial [Bacteroidetes bacterium]|nr:T9SS type A sorting domain-containing protein [Bacteroidota bacterium]
NPCPGRLTVRCASSIHTVELYGLNGQRISAQVALAEREAEVRASYRGMAMIRVQTEEGMVARKVVFE